MAASTIPTLLVQGNNKPGLGSVIAQAIAAEGINVAFLVAQVIDKRFSAVMGFEDEAACECAAKLIKKSGQEKRRSSPCPSPQTWMATGESRLAAEPAIGDSDQTEFGGRSGVTAASLPPRFTCRGLGGALHLKREITDATTRSAAPILDGHCLRRNRRHGLRQATASDRRAGCLSHDPPRGPHRHLFRRQGA